METKTIVPVTIRDRNICDFCGIQGKTAQGDRDVAVEDENIELCTADICYGCASQIAQLLAGSAEVGEDGQVQL